MLKILDTQQIRALDDYTIQHKSIASIDLMERACLAFVQWFVTRFDATKKIDVICGTGNNGGDGLGIARILHDWGYSVNVWIVQGSMKETEDFKINLGRMPEKIKVSKFTDSSQPEVFSSHVLIDAIFGSGLSRSPEGIYERAIQSMNDCQAVRIAVDIPSGLFTDKHSKGTIVHADYTVSFQMPKLAFLFPENNKYVGKWSTVDIGLDKNFIKEAKTSYYLLTPWSVKKILRQRSTFDHKGHYGHALMIAGSYGKMGACVLAARASLRAGVGLLTVHIPKTGYSILQSTVPEAMTSMDINNEVFSECPSLDSYDVIGVGPGLGRAEETTTALKKVFVSGKSMVVDADALNIISAHPALIQSIPARSILTPHPKEFERLVGPWKDDFERLEKQIRLAKETKCTIILKGAHTSIATPEGDVYFNNTGNPGMATGGSGDVLTGILTGLFAQKYSADETAILGVYLHGLAGDIAAHEKGVNSLIASDLIDFLPAAFKDLLRITSPN